MQAVCSGVEAACQQPHLSCRHNQPHRGECTAQAVQGAPDVDGTAPCALHPLLAVHDHGISQLTPCRSRVRLPHPVPQLCAAAAQRGGSLAVPGGGSSSCGAAHAPAAPQRKPLAGRDGVATERCELMMPCGSVVCSRSALSSRLAGPPLLDSSALPPVRAAWRDGAALGSTRRAAAARPMLAPRHVCPFAPTLFGPSFRVSAFFITALPLEFARLSHAHPLLVGIIMLPHAPVIMTRRWRQRWPRASGGWPAPWGHASPVQRPMPVLLRGLEAHGQLL